VWSPWICPGCAARLRYDNRSNRWAFVPVVLGWSAIAWGVVNTSYVMGLGGLLLMNLTALVTMMTRPVRVEAEGPFCRGCGYDLSDGPPACPECGSACP
jgi:hypothetical protein